MGKTCLLVLHTKMQYTLTEHTYIKQIMFNAEGRQGTMMENGENGICMQITWLRTC